MRIAIAGAGVAGAYLGSLLRRRGLDPEVYDPGRVRQPLRLPPVRVGRPRADRAAPHGGGPRS